MELLNHLNLNRNQLLNAVLENLESHPENPSIGQAYFNTTDNKTYIWNGTVWDLLRGDKGDKGDKGDNGDNGEDGIIGVDGDKGDKGDKGHQWLGLYDPEYEYPIDSVVRYDGSAYIRIVDSMESQPPTNELYWDLFVQRGEDGGGGEGGSGGSGEVLRLTNVYTATTNGVTNIPIGIDDYDSSIDILEVTFAQLSLDASNFSINASGTSIDLTGWSINIGDAIYFYVWKGSLAEGTYLTVDDTPSLVRKSLSAKTYYVDPSGNDGNIGSSESPFKTIAKAVSMVPQICNHDYTINVNAGTYSESIEVAGFSGAGSISITGSLNTISTTRKVKNISIIRCMLRVGINGFQVTENHPTLGNVGSVYVTGCINAQLRYINDIFAGVGWYIVASTGQAVSCVVSNKGYAFQVASYCFFHMDSNTGTGNTYVNWSSGGGIISIAGTQPSGVNQNTITTGGMIVPSAGVLNPWGDNNTASRTALYAYKTATQAITAGTWTKVLFQSNSYDNMGEFSNESSIFQAKQSGIYLFNATVRFATMPASTNTQIRLMRNNASVHVLDVQASSTAISDMVVGGDRAISLTAGDVVEVNVYVSKAATIDSDPAITSLLITRVS